MAGHNNCNHCNAWTLLVSEVERAILYLSGRHVRTRGKRIGLSGTDEGCAGRCLGWWWRSVACRSTCGRRDGARPPSSRPGSRTSGSVPSTCGRSEPQSSQSPRHARTSRWTSPENSVFASLRTSASQHLQPVRKKHVIVLIIFVPVASFFSCKQTLKAFPNKIRYDTIRYIYVRSKANVIASLI